MLWKGDLEVGGIVCLEGGEERGEDRGEERGGKKGEGRRGEDGFKG